MIKLTSPFSSGFASPSSSAYDKNCDLLVKDMKEEPLFEIGKKRINEGSEKTTGTERVFFFFSS